MSANTATVDVDGPAMAHAHHFENLDQQNQAATLGMWVFLATEVLFFGGPLTAFAVLGGLHLHDFIAASERLSVPLATANTVVLLGSSLTVALAVRAAQQGSRRWLCGYLAATVVLGSAFLGIKAVEYAHDYAEGLVPSLRFTAGDWPEGVNIHHAELFFFFYFFLTLLHAVHMLVGLTIWTIVLVMAYRGRFSPARHSPVEVTGLYWHFVDVVWVFLFPLLYLLRH